MKRKFTIEILLNNERSEALITLIPSLDDKILEKYSFTTYNRMDPFIDIKNKMIERAKQEPDIYYKLFGS